MSETKRAVSMLLRRGGVESEPRTSLRSVGTGATGRPEPEQAKKEFSRRRRIGLLGGAAAPIIDVTSGSTSALVAARLHPLRARERVKSKVDGAKFR